MSLGARSTTPNAPLVDREGFMHPAWRKLWLQIWEASGAEIMANTFRLIAPQALQNSAVQLFVSSRAKTQVTKVLLANTDGANAHTVTVYYVPQGQAPQASNQVLSALSLAAGETKEATAIEDHVLNQGDSIYAFADTANVVTIAVTGVQLA